MVSVSVSKFFGIEKSIGIGFEKFWYRKKYWFRFRKFLVSEKVSVSVSKNFGIDKSIGIGFEKFGIEKNRNQCRQNLVQQNIRIQKVLDFFWL